VYLIRVAAFLKIIGQAFAPEVAAEFCYQTRELLLESEPCNRREPRSRSEPWCEREPLGASEPAPGNGRRLMSHQIATQGFPRATDPCCGAGRRSAAAEGELRRMRRRVLLQSATPPEQAAGPRAGSLEGLHRVSVTSIARYPSAKGKSVLSCHFTYERAFPSGRSASTFPNQGLVYLLVSPGFVSEQGRAAATSTWGAIGGLML
jgi:hypothetical protein